MDISIRQGETLELNITADDLTADTVELIVADTEGSVIINETANFDTVDNKRIATISTLDTDHPVAEYEYMLTIVYEDGYIEKLPDVSDCEGDCSLPKLNICKSLEVAIS